VKDAADSVAYLRKKATEAPFSIRELTSTFVKLKASGIDPTNGSLQALTDGIAAFGGSDEQLHRVTLGITQMSGKSVIQMEEMRQQLGESMPTAMRLMARSMGVSVSELIGAISTGRVESKTALEGFFQELERAYGGDAQRMMSTFSGQVTQMTANFQNLATQGGLAEFFENLKGYLQQFNDFLKSSDAKNAADEFGKALSSVAAFASRTAKMLYEMRDTIKLAIEAFLGFAAIRGITSVFSKVIQSVQLTTASLATLPGAFSRASSGFAAGSAALGAGAGIASRMGLAFGAAGTAILGIGTAIGAVIPWLPLLAAGTYFLADKFGLLSNKTDDAYQSLVRYGAESRAQAQETLDAKEKELRQAVEDAKWRYANDFNAARYKTGKLLAIEDAQKELDEFLAQKEAHLLLAADREAQVEIEKQDRLMKIRTAGINSEYDKRQTEIDNAYQREREAAAKAGKSVTEIDERYQKETLEARKTLLKEKIAIFDKEIEALNIKFAIAAAENDSAAEMYIASLIDHMTAQRLQLLEELSNTKDIPGISLINPVDDGSKAIEKGQQMLDGLREDVKGLAADIEGASGEYAKMQYRIARGDFGSIEDGGEAVRELHQALLDATAQKEALDKVMSSNKAAEGDLRSLKDQIARDAADLEARRSGQTVGKAEEMLNRLRNGYYEGLGPVESIRAALQNITGLIDTQGIISVQLANTWKMETFGDSMVVQINKIREALSFVGDEMRALRDSTSFVNFGGMGMPGLANIRTKVDGGILDLIASGESGGDYNATLDNGRWTNGSQNLTAMTLNEIRSLQRMMLENPENRALYGNGLGSSALGRYQIVGQTLQGLMDSLGLTGNELFDERMQDRLAAQLVAQRGNNPAGLRQEWTSLNNVSDAEIQAALGRSMNGPTQFRANMGTTPVAPVTLNDPTLTWDGSAYSEMTTMQEQFVEEQTRKTEELTRELLKLKETEEATLTGNQELDRQNAIDDFIEKTKIANSNVEDMGKNYERALDLIESGKLGSTDVGAEQYKALLDAARELDAAEDARAARDKAKRQSAEDLKGLEEDRAKLAKDIADAQARADNPDYEAQSASLLRLNQQLDEYVQHVKDAYGENSPQYKEALSYRDSMVASGLRLEGEKTRAELGEQTRDLQDSLLTQRQLRMEEMNRALADVDRKAQIMRDAGISEVQITEEVEAAKKAIRDKYNHDTYGALADQMVAWGDIGANLQDASARWMDSAATGIAGLITGTGDLRSAVTGVINDVANMGVRYMMSNILPMGGAGGKAGAGKAGLKAGVPVMHSGGIVGGQGLARTVVNSSVFKGALKYHGGGMIGSRRLSPGEVPIIAKRGEGVFTPEQMRSMGGFMNTNQFQINAPVTVNGSSGTPQQNADLAKQISREMEGAMRNVVIDEIRRQSRPGNMMGSRK
jgi:tape measure domain-containing protein